MLYEWIKALHVISIIAWMAGLLYLPRLFVYHCQAPAGSEASETFKVMERRLLRAIMNPAMIAAYVFGITMIVLTPEWMKQGWLHAKLLFVLLLTASHMMMARWRRDFAEDRNTRPQRFYRIANEVPTLLMIGIVIFVIVKPF
ncbi:protoporphyrinogen oxidase HemJ [Azospirillum melinis]|uniref:Protoporphyrinogen IX oxidase n=1 Tax=Azospirillum melinis TaxID=328839 RepID=A0ABX2KM61_9PROT|nr:putative membrane protein [Azospirillum melinis]NUB03466.1 protoporphyrinogen oxidase HemJ [Azospirillum melinis]